MKKILAPVLAFILVCACLFGLNTVTAPVIAENASASLLGPLAEVLPGSGAFEELELADLPETVTAIYQEGSGLGYSAKLATTQGYTGGAIETALGVSADGKITGLQITEYPDTKDVTEEFIASFTDKDSALAGVDLVSGATFSSSAIRNAVADALNYMAENGMITAGVKSDAQIFAEMLPSVCPGIANAQGILQLAEDSTENLMLAANGAVAAAISDAGLQIVNTAGEVKTFDAEGNEVDEAAGVDISAVALAATNDEDLKKLSKLVGENAEFEAVPVAGYTCVTSAFKVTDGDATYYAFGTRPYAYSNEIMPVFFILDENGAIVKMTAPEFILHGDYFTDYTLDKDAYKAGFEGVTADTYSDDLALVSGATMTSDAVSMATRAVFDVFAAIAGGAA